MTMTCKEALDLIHQILDGEAQEAALAELSAHTEACADCAQAWESLSGVDALLRETDGHEPDAAYFDALASTIGARVYERQYSPKPSLVLPWVRSLGMAAACLVVGVFAGRAAFPVAVTKTVTEERIVEVEVPGPTVEVVKEVPVEVIKEVPVEVVRWRTRTVVKRVPVEAEQPAPMVAARGPAGPAGPSGPAGPAGAAGPAPPRSPASGATRFAAWAPGSAARFASAPSADDIRVLAAGLVAGGRTIDDAISAPALASALVSGMSAADASVEAGPTPAEPQPHTP